jgi:DNA-binding transcriptional LysR family regulator
MDLGREASGNSPERGANIRLLDFDDLLVLKSLLAGETVAATAKGLGLTQPAITQRVRKMERVFGTALLRKSGRHVKLTPFGAQLCTKAAEALSVMMRESALPQPKMRAMGLASGYGGVALKVPVSGDGRCHWQISDAGILLGRLETGGLDAVIAGAGLSDGNQKNFLIGEISYHLVKRADAKPLWIEAHREKSIFSLVSHETRTASGASEIWQVPDDAFALRAVLAGEGAALLPSFIAEPQVSAQKLEMVVAEAWTDALYCYHRIDAEPESLRHLLKDALADIPGLLESPKI